MAIDTQEQLEKRLKGTESLHVEMKGPEAEMIEAIKQLPGVKSVSAAQDGLMVDSELGRDVREDLFQLAVQRRWPILELRPVSMSLEEVFIKLTTKEDGASATS